MTWLITGGAGYIGAHVLRAFLDAGEQCVVLDDLSTGEPERVPASVPLVVGDICDRDLVQGLFAQHEVTGVVHIAGKKSVPESMGNPELYERVNVDGTQVLLEACEEFAVRPFVFSSSASVYGVVDHNRPIMENEPTVPINPYGQTKLDAERLIEKACANSDMTAVAFRYFNVGGSSSELLADHCAVNLIPIVQRAVDSGGQVSVFGTDLPTRDGSCIRDYVHVEDLAAAHLAAARYLQTAAPGEFAVMNLGTGVGSTVLEVIHAVSEAEGKPVRWIAAPHREGDPVASTCDASRAEAMLGWQPKRLLSDIVSRPKA